MNRLLNHCWALLLLVAPGLAYAIEPDEVRSFDDVFRISAQAPSSDLSPNLQAIVDFIRPSVERCRRESPDADAEALVEQAVRANVRHTVNELQHGSPVLEELHRRGELRIAGAEYSLQTGQVEFLD